MSDSYKAILKMLYYIVPNGVDHIIAAYTYADIVLLFMPEKPRHRKLLLDFLQLPQNVENHPDCLSDNLPTMASFTYEVDSEGLIIVSFYFLKTLNLQVLFADPKHRYTRHLSSLIEVETLHSKVDEKCFNKCFKLEYICPIDYRQLPINCSHMFNECKQLEYAPFIKGQNQTFEIANGMFEYCLELKTCHFTASALREAKRIFHYCSSLMAAELKVPEECDQVGAFFGCRVFSDEKRRNRAFIPDPDTDPEEFSDTNEDEDARLARTCAQYKRQRLSDE